MRSRSQHRQETLHFLEGARREIYTPVDESENPPPTAGEKHAGGKGDLRIQRRNNGALTRSPFWSSKGKGQRRVEKSESVRLLFQMMQVKLVDFLETKLVDFHPLLFHPFRLLLSWTTMVLAIFPHVSPGPPLFFILWSLSFPIPGKLAYVFLPFFFSLV
jgi:hypothetical protein